MRGHGFDAALLFTAIPSLMFTFDTLHSHLALFHSKYRRTQQNSIGVTGFFSLHIYWSNTHSLLILACYLCMSASPKPCFSAFVHNRDKPNWTPAIPPHAFMKSPSCRSFRSAVQGEWSLITRSMLPSFTACHSPSCIKRLIIMHYR